MGIPRSGGCSAPIADIVSHVAGYEIKRRCVDVVALLKAVSYKARDSNRPQAFVHMEHKMAAKKVRGLVTDLLSGYVFQPALGFPDRDAGRASWY